MEISFKWPSFYFCLLCFQLCNGNPITPNSTEIDSQTKLLTGIISLLLTVCGLVFIAACLCCQRRQSFEKFRNSPVIGYSISDVEHGHVNPITNGEFTIFSPLSPPHFNNNVIHANTQTKSRTVGDSVESFYDIRSWFSPTENDFPRNRLKYIIELGSGWFGKVVQGAAQDLNDADGQSWSPVVVRILEATSSQTEKILFLQDAAIYRCGCHTNVLSLVGRSLETVPYLLLQEYCPQGDLKHYLQSNKADAEKLLSTEYPLIWCCQLTSAVKHIHQNNIVHHDLASRNCQLTSNLTLKLGDYGLAPFRYPSDYYQGLPTVPVRWCAPESLVCTQTTIQPKKITAEANVWSLGVTMWEVCECGEQPYKALNDDEVISQVLVSSNVRLGRPTYSALYTDYIFRLMQSCWTSAESRPTASQIDIMLTDLLQVHRNTTYNTLEIDEFDRRWESCKPNTIIKTDHITEVLLTPESTIKKSLSPSLTKLHGSLDNLAEETKNDSHRTSASDISDLEINAKEPLKTEFKINSSSLFQRTTSSGSETEDENWRNKVERGAYTEKVRQKSRSVADLMVLTHVDYSESESETPLPSLDYRVNYRNVRLAGLEGSNYLENASITFGSEGNLLSLQDTFQEELKKLQEERRDSLPLVPDTVSENTCSNKEVPIPSKLMQEFNSTVDIQPANQIFNVYNVTIDTFSPIKIQNALEETIEDKRELDCRISRESANCDNKFGSDSVKNEEEDNRRIKEEIGLKDSEVYSTESNCNETPTESIVLSINEAAIDSSFDERIVAIVDDIIDAAILKIISKEEQINNANDEEIIIEVADINNDMNKGKYGDNEAENNDKVAKEIEEGICQQSDEDKYQKEEASEAEKNNKVTKEFKESTCPNSDDVKYLKEEETEAEKNQEVVKEIEEVIYQNSEEVKHQKEEGSEAEVNHKVAKEVEEVIYQNSEEVKHQKEEGSEAEVNHKVAKEVEEVICQKSDEVKHQKEEETEAENDHKVAKEIEEANDRKSDEVKYLKEETYVEDIEGEKNQEINEAICQKSEEVKHQKEEETEAEKNHKVAQEIEEAICQKTEEVKYLKKEETEAGTNNKLTKEIEEANDQKSDEVKYLKDEKDIKQTKAEKNQIIEEGMCGNSSNINHVPKLTDIILSNENLKSVLDSRESTEDSLSPVVHFDLSLDQKQAMPNSLTHSTLFCSTPFRKREVSLPSEDKYSSLNLFNTEDDLDEDSLSFTPLNYSLETWDNFLGTTLDNQEHPENTFDSFTSEPQSLLFVEDEKCEVNNRTRVLSEENPQLNATYRQLSATNGQLNATNGQPSATNGQLNDQLNATYNLNKTYDLNVKTSEDALNGTYDVDKDGGQGVSDSNEVQGEGESAAMSKKDSEVLQCKLSNVDPNEGSFENGGGWFLHPQPTNELCGNIEIQSPSTDSYIGFGIDDEIMSAIRNELLSKLPHAQGANADRIKEEEDWDSCERNEVFLRYNVYNTPLSPIPEESYVEDVDESLTMSPKPKREHEDADWSSGRTDTDTLTHEIESNSAHTLESPLRGQFNRHTPSQDSCCSNDTLFNLEELICATTDLEKDADASSNLETDNNEMKFEETLKNDIVDSELADINNTMYINEFLMKERKHSLDSNKFKSVAPLSSPEDNPWKQLPASLLNFKSVTPDKQLLLEESPVTKEEEEDDNSQLLLEESPVIKEEEDNSQLLLEESPVIKEEEDNSQLLLEESPVAKEEEEEEDDNSTKKEEEQSEEQNLTYTKESPDVLHSSPTSLNKMASLTSSQSLEDVEEVPVEQENSSDKENVDPLYQNSGIDEHVYENEEPETGGSYEEYVNIVNMENDRNKEAYIDIYGHDEEAQSEDDNIYGILTDIRFTGPTDSQMMSTSFSENNDEQGWESGSDSRSSSSGEFIWKGGEHEESLKALRAAPQDAFDTMKPMEGIAEDAYEDSDLSSSFTDDEETPEFVPSAWDKFAIPSKSALRSPEKTLIKSEERKPKGVWFKKQKYHCIYEYPKEPESPILPTQDLWKPQTDLKSFSDWEFDGEAFEPSQTSDETTNYANRTNSILSNQNLYHLTSITDFIPENCNSTNSDRDFFISGSTQPFHAHSISSQFFPGSSGIWTFENATPDSGVEDVTPGSTTDSNEYDNSTKRLPSLKQLASEAVAKKKLLNMRNSEVMGGLRHTRNKLKLDLPPSPSAFTSDKPFTIEPMLEHVVREKPSFTTFGKSRFMVQQVDTPPDDTKTKNVSFEALPYQPFNPVIKDHTDVIERSFVKDEEEDDRCKLKVEVVRGEASLLDSGDEDSGIESASTLERKITNSQLS